VCEGSDETDLVIRPAWPGAVNTPNELTTGLCK